MIHCLLARGVESIIVSEPSPTRAAHAQAAGAHHVFNPSKDNVPDICFGLTAGLGVHTVFECAGIQAAFDVALASVRGGGTIVNVAIYETSLTLHTPNTLNRRSITYVGSNTYTRGEFQEVIEALASGECLGNWLDIDEASDNRSGKIKTPETMITSKVPLTSAVEQGFRELLLHKDRHVKILIDPSQ